jgi:cytochrome c553
VLGLFLGALVGVFATIALGTTGPSESFEDYQKRAQVEQPSSAKDPHAGQQPRADGPPRAKPQRQPRHAGDPGQSIAKVHFMKKFVKALTEVPQNKHPNLNYVPVLRDPKNPLRCADCHDTGTINVEQMLNLDPGPEKVEPYRQAPQFMIKLMSEWVARLNKRHADRLIKPVTCTDCHAVDPREKFRVFPALMSSFVSALKTKPTNKSPASNWKPLLKDASEESMLCAVCHGEVGTAMERNLPNWDLARPAKYADNKEFMVHLMEEWVEELNTKASSMLTKAVVCRDCHETDPRR